MEELLLGRGLEVHYCQADVDHNRTVTAFSGEIEAVFDGVRGLADITLDRIDLNRHVGVHPRIGGLDVCPFVLCPSPPDGEGQGWGGEATDAQEPLPPGGRGVGVGGNAPSDHTILLARVESFAREFSGRWQIPVYLYEESERGRHEADLPSLRKGGFGSLLERELSPDFGPTRCHPHLGVTVMGVRGFLIALNVNLDSRHIGVARDLARRIRALRQEGDPRFLGVRALGLLLASRDMVQVSMNLTLPDATPVDPIVDWVRDEAANLGCKYAGTELIGVIRARDLEGATHVRAKPAQILEGW